VIFNLSMVSWGGGSLVWGWSLGVDSGTLVGDISDISIISIAGVLDVLDSAIGKSDGVRSSNVGGTIRLLLSVEGSLGVVISNSVGVSVGGDLIGVLLHISSLHWGVVSWSWGVVGWGSVDSVGNNWGSVDGVGNWVSNNWGMDSVGSVDNWSSMDSVVERGSVDSVGNNWGMDSVDSMGNNSISTVKSVGGISNNSSVGAESLALGGGSVFSLVRLADRLVAHLTMSISIDWSVSSVVDWSNGTRHWGGQDWSVDSSVVTHEPVTEVSSGGSQDSAEADEGLHVYVFVLS